MIDVAEAQGARSKVGRSGLAHIRTTALRNGDEIDICHIKLYRIKTKKDDLSIILSGGG